MESPTSELEVFSSLSMQEYIRLMTAAYYLQHDNKCVGAMFKISAENYAKMLSEPLHTPLIGLTLTFNTGQETLTAVPTEDFLHQYDNKIMAEVIEQYHNNYKNRYASRLLLLEE